jgi:hypothetical protein
MSGSYYWTGAQNLQQDYIAGAIGSGVPGMNVALTSAHAVADSLERVLFDVYAIIDVEPTGPNKPQIGWWINVAQFVGLWCDQGLGVPFAGLPVPGAIDSYEVSPGWLTNTMLTPLSTLQGTYLSFGYQVVYGLPKGTLDVEARRTNLASIAPQTIYGSWVSDSLVSPIAPARSGNVDYAVSLRSQIRALWKTH